MIDVHHSVGDENDGEKGVDVGLAEFLAEDLVGQGVDLGFLFIALGLVLCDGRRLGTTLVLRGAGRLDRRARRLEGVESHT